MRIGGVSGFKWEAVPLVRRDRSRRARKRPCRYWMVGPRWAILWDWIPHEGWWAWRLHRDGPAGELLHESNRPPRLLSMKRRIALGVQDEAIPALPGESEVLKSFPKIREFLSVTAYDKNDARVPGSFRLENKLICYQITWYDPDSGMRLPVSGGTLDDVLKASERLLGAPDAPWEVDRYLTEQLAKKVKKGGSKGKRK